MGYEEYLYKSYLNANPFEKHENIKKYKMITTYDLLIKYKNGKKVLYEIEDDYTRILPYKNETLTDDEFKLEFSLRLQRFMRLKYIRQDELADLVGTSQTMISHYMNGKVLPNANMIGKIANALNLPIQDFYYRES